MTKAAVNYLLCFLAGSAFAFGIIAAVDGSWRWDFVAPLRLFGLNEIAWIVGPAALTLCLLGVLSFYWSDASALAKRATAQAGLSSTTPPAAQPTAQLPREQREQGDVRAVREELERQLGRLIVLIAGQLKSSSDHVTALQDTNAQLASVTTVAEIREVVRTLISKNEANERQTRDLETRLKEAQAQASVLKQRLTQAEKLASLDPLTSVANRRRFEQFISVEVERSHRNGTPLCLIMTDIDHFKRVNDKYGHSAGDRVLKAFADLLTRSVRGADLVARYGGEEFALVLPQTPMGDAFAIAERIRNAFELHGGPDESLAGELGRLTASFGVAEIREGEPPSVLIRRADQMLYEAKNKGRNTTIIWSSSTAALEDGRA